MNRKGEAVIEIDGKSFRIAITYNNAADAEHNMTRDVIAMMTGGTIGFSDARALFYEAVKGQHEVFTLEQAGELLGRSGQWGKIANLILTQVNALFALEVDEEGKS